MTPFCHCTQDYALDLTDIALRGFRAPGDPKKMQAAAAAALQAGQGHAGGAVAGTQGQQQGGAGGAGKDRPKSSGASQGPVSVCAQPSGSSSSPSATASAAPSHKLEKLGKALSIPGGPPGSSQSASQLSFGPD